MEDVDQDGHGPARVRVWRTMEEIKGPGPVNCGQNIGEKHGKNGENMGNIGKNMGKMGFNAETWELNIITVNQGSLII